MNSHDYLLLSNKLEDCIGLAKKAGQAADVELLREMFLRYYKKYSNVRDYEQKGQCN